MNFDLLAIRNYAIEKHKNQKYGKHEYIYHLDRVYDESLYYNLPPIVSAASFLHDVIEDTDTTYEDILIKFKSIELADLVESVTDEPGKNRKERKAKTYPKINSNPNAVALKLCDRIANVKACYGLLSRGLLKMYRKEQEEFESQIRTAGVYENMWSDLTELLKE